jgi:hypothetical protein
MAGAMSAVLESATATAENRRNAQFNESDIMAKFRDRMVRDIAKNGNPDHALTVGRMLNEVLATTAAGREKIRDENSLKTIVATALIAANKNVPDEFKSNIPKVAFANPETDVETDEVKTDSVVTDAKPEQEERQPRRGRPARAA